MPRPKRSKVARAGPKPAPGAIPAPDVVERTTGDANVTQHFGDDSDELVRASGRRSARRLTVQKDIEVAMSGGLGLDNVRYGKVESNRTTASYLSHEAERAAKRTSITQPQPMSKVQDSGSRGRATRRLASESPAGRPAATPGPKAQNTPGVDASFHSIANFKRRPRQPSILRMVQQTAAAESNISDSFALNDESALLGTALSHTTTPIQVDQHNYDLRETRSSSSRKRKLAELEDEPMPSSPPQLLDNGLRDNEQLSDSADLPAIQPTDRDSVLVEPEVYSETMAPPLSSSSPAPTPVPIVHESLPKRKRSLYVEPSSPLSSDAMDKPESRVRTATNRLQRNLAPPSSVFKTATLQSLLPQRRNARQTLRNNTFDILSSSDYEHNVPKPNEPPESSDLDASADDLHRSTRRPTTIRRRPAAPAPAKKPLSKRQPPNASTKLKRKGPRDRSPTKPHNAAAAAASSTKPKPRHARRLSNKENPASSSDDDTAAPNVAHEHSSFLDEDQDIVVAPHKRKKQKQKLAPELAAAAQKFHDVDAWALEFESVDRGGGLGSSSPLWR